MKDIPQQKKLLVHLANEGVDVVLTVTSVTTLNEVVELARVETTVGVGELEGPEEVGDLFEVLPHVVDLVNHVLHAYHVVLP